VIETSSGNFQAFYPFSHALPPQEAHELAGTLADAIGCDHGTGDVVHIWRVPGTLNWPNRKKLERGRPHEPQPVKVASAWTRELIDPKALKAAVASHSTPDSEPKSNGQDHTSDTWQLLFATLPETLEKLITSPPLPGEDRSAVAAGVIRSLIGRGWSDAKIAAVITAHPQGVGARYAEGKDLEADIARLRGKYETGGTEPAPTPIDLWAKLSPPALPRGVLRHVIECFAFEQGEMMGADPAGLAVAALTVCGAAIPDRIQLQVKEHDYLWLESARLWVALIGLPSTKKTPELKQAARPLVQIDSEMAQTSARKKAEYDALPPEERKTATPPKRTRLRIEDATIEAAGEILKDSPAGVLSLQDELSGWFGGMDKYSSGRGAQKDRGFWLQAFNGGDYCVERIGRGSLYIPNLSVSLLGCIQPGLLRKIINDTVDDGLIQRLIPIVLLPASVDKDVEQSSAVQEYEDLVRHLHRSGHSSIGLDCYPVIVRFSPEAQRVRQRLAEKHVSLTNCEMLSPKLAAHIGKYDTIFARLCLIWHCIERRSRNARGEPISEDVALRVEKFLHGFLLPHAASFYAAALQLSDDHDRLTAVAGYILAHKLEVVSPRDIARGDRTMRGLSKAETSKVFEQLEALCWIRQAEGPRRDAPRWIVNPECHRCFAERAEKETQRRQSARVELQKLFQGGN
jgi:Protein of unknown function (DUF3987)/RepB DNA-primase from phage plasmid